MVSRGWFRASPRSRRNNRNDAVNLRNVRPHSRRRRRLFSERDRKPTRNASGNSWKRSASLRERRHRRKYSPERFRGHLHRSSHRYRCGPSANRNSAPGGRRQRKSWCCSSPRKLRRLKSSALLFHRLFRPKPASRVRGSRKRKRKQLRRQKWPLREQMIRRASAHRLTQFGNELCVPRMRCERLLSCEKFLGHHAAFNHRISFSKRPELYDQRPRFCRLVGMQTTRLNGAGIRSGPRTNRLVANVVKRVTSLLLLQGCLSCSLR